jgi:uncharacterized membrane protein YphA (DoxX/SURF4 family)
MADQILPAGSAAPTSKRCRLNGSRVESDTRLRSLLPFFLRILLGVVFLYASYDKILHPGAFARAVHNYQILPSIAVNPVAVILPWIELLLGFCLVVGAWLPGTMVLSTLLLAVFNGALIFNLSRGLDVSCGCFSTQIAGSPATWWTAVRDVTLLVASIWLTVSILSTPSPDNAPDGGDGRPLAPPPEQHR